MHKCLTPYCRHKTKGSKHCSTCRSRMSRANNPVRHAYNNLEAHAKERGKTFTITLDYFTRFCHSVQYIGMAGRNANSKTVDRIKEELGYIPGNLQILPNGENVKKYFNYDWRSGEVSFTPAAVPATDDFDSGFEEELLPF